MDKIIPRDAWVGVIEPYYPAGKRGRPPMGIEKMLRMLLLQIWFNPSAPAIENRKSPVRCKAEHVFRIIECPLGYKKTVYRRLKKNENRLYIMFA